MFNVKVLPHTGVNSDGTVMFIPIISSGLIITSHSSGGGTPSGYSIVISTGTEETIDTKINRKKIIKITKKYFFFIPKIYSFVFLYVDDGPDGI